MAISKKDVYVGEVVQTKLYMVTFVWRKDTNSGYGTFNKCFKRDIPSCDELIECNKNLKEQHGYDEVVIIGWNEIYDDVKSLKDDIGKKPH